MPAKRKMARRPPTRRKKPAKKTAALAPSVGAGTAAGATAGAPVTKSFTATAYGPPWDAMNGTGVSHCEDKSVDMTDGKIYYVIAVDPSVIPCGSQVSIEPNPYEKGRTFTAADVGGAIDDNHIDIYIGDENGDATAARAKQLAWGTRTVQVGILGADAFKGDDVKTPIDGNIATDAIDAIKSPIQAVLDLLRQLFEPSFWQRVGKIVLGAVALIVGVGILGRAVLGVDLGVGERSGRRYRSVRAARNDNRESKRDNRRAGEREREKAAGRAAGKQEGREAQRRSDADWRDRVNREANGSDPPF